ncbi:MAG: DEAD/DEAH box helicase [Alphaproteobacteria bacterium]|nr:DEAD/DEAH box helicase [Alphaproteobacteria bacterium]
MPLSQITVPALARAIEKRGYETLTPVQSAILAGELRDADLMVSAQTGSGKTVAFGLALAHTLLGGQDKFDKARDPLALIIAPTRELAMQVKAEIQWLYAEAGGVVASCVGGMDARDERRALDRGAHIVVGTPGRLVDHLHRGSLVLNSLKAVVLDEADEMLNLGFREELETILDTAPADRRTLMFSATMPRSIATLAGKYQRDAQRVNTISSAKQHTDIEYLALTAGAHDIENAIFNVLRYHDAANALVFCGTRAAVTHLQSRFSNRGFSVVALSGELSQKERTYALQALRDHRANVCIATDVAARGLDLPDLDLVIHAEIPKNPEALLHRSGRTGRAGRKGTSVLIVPYPARRRTERLLRDAKIEARWSEPPSADDVKRRDQQRLLDDAVLSEPIAEDERAIISALLERHDVDQIAAAFARLYRKGQPAPEDLMAPPPNAQNPTRPEPRPQGFDQSAWITLTIGYAQKAEPRWLIPMLCKAGGITKRDIGTIRIEDRVTHVELNAAAVEGFFTHLDADGRIEKNVYAMPMREQAAPRADNRERPQGAERHERPQRQERPERQDRPQRAERQDRAPRQDRPERQERQERPATARPGRKERQAQDTRRGKPPAGKHPAGGKPHKKKKWNPAD